MIIVGLTGSVGTGKSTVTNFFRELGAYIIDWDELARKVTSLKSLERNNRVFWERYFE
jgi:dephospho-CoA kinase